MTSEVFHLKVEQKEKWTLPVFSENELILVHLLKEEGFDPYLDEIKEAYGYTDRVFCDCDFLDHHGNLLSLGSRGILFDVLHAKVSATSFDQKIESGYCMSEAELMMYPKLYVVLRSIFLDNNSFPIHLAPLAEYFVEKKRIDQEDYQQCKKKEVVSSKMSISEKKDDISQLKSIVYGLEKVISVDFLESYAIRNPEMEASLDVSSKKYEQFQNYYYVAKNNSFAIDYLKQVEVNHGKTFCKRGHLS